MCSSYCIWKNNKRGRSASASLASFMSVLRFLLFVAAATFEEVIL